jgi:21S rRNA (uridine2791-2'-O)-methyltransferase
MTSLHSSLLSHIMFTTLSFVKPRGSPAFGVIGQIRQSSSKRWQARQHKDKFAREAAVQGLKSRAAFKLLQVSQVALAS